MSRPRVVLKIAASLDGRIALANGQSRWITGPEARAEVHRLRAASDAVLTGSGTALADDPELTARTEPKPARQPMRVVLDSALRLPLTSKLVATIPNAPLTIVGAHGADQAAVRALEQAGAQVALVPRGEAGVDLPAALGALVTEGVKTVLAECGGRLAASLLKAGLVDQLELVRAPIVLGGDAQAGLGALGLTELTAAPRFRRLAVRTFGDDLWESFERA